MVGGRHSSLWPQRNMEASYHNILISHSGDNEIRIVNTAELFLNFSSTETKQSDYSMSQSPWNTSVCVNLASGVRVVLEV